jgi:hypothetical protein
VRRSGSSSWSLSVSDEASLDLALYVRDALRLDTRDPLSPPGLVDSPPDRSDLLDGSEPGDVSQQWAAWWRTALAFETRWRRRAPGPDLESWVRERGEDRARTVGDSPDFAALTESPALQRAVVALHEEARRRPDRGAGAEAGAPYDLVRSTAEETIARHGVSPDRVNGIVFVVSVDGLWWRLVEPGVVVCSAACLQNTRTTAQLLREVFESGLAPGTPSASS